MANAITERLAASPQRHFSPAAEAAVIGSILLDGDVIAEVLSLINCEDFYLDKHRKLFSLVTEMFMAGDQIDSVLVRDRMETVGLLDEIGFDYYAKLLEAVPIAANAAYYAQQVKDKRRYRDLLTAVSNAANVVDESLPVDEQIEKVRSIVFGMADQSGQEAYSFAEYAEAVSQEDPNVETILTGFRDLDNVTGGFQPGQLVVLAGRPSMGKSALGLDIAVKQAEYGAGVIIFSLEMTHKQLIRRLLRTETAEKLASLDITISGADTVEKQVAMIKAKQGRCDLVVIDYLQQMKTDKAETKNVEVGNITRDLKKLALRENLTVLLESQLNRGPEQRPDRRPRMSDLRDSGSVEQDADIVMLMFRADYYRKEDGLEKDHTAEVIVDKNRDGATGVVKLMFSEECVRFGDLTYGAY